METQLSRMTTAERWSAWPWQGDDDDRDGDTFLRVTEAGGRTVALSRWDVHGLLVDATEAAFAAPRTGDGGAQELKVHVCQRGGGEQQVKAVWVQRPATADAWIAELRSIPTVQERFYRVGSWIVQVRAPDYYAAVFGATTAEDAERFRRSTPFGASYKEMFRSSADGHDRSRVVWALLRGGAVSAVPAAMAQLSVAMCVSEAVRNWRTWGINLMVLDLLAQNQGLTWNGLILDELHPMAHGGTFDKQGGKTGMKGGRSSRDTWALETCVTMAWLRTRGDLAIEAFEGPEGKGGREQGWRDPVKGQAHGGPMRRRMTDRVLQRIRKL